MRRRLQYWRAIDHHGIPVTQPSPIDLVATLRHSASVGLDRYWECRNGMTVLAHPVAVTNEPVMILDRVRTSNYPSAGDANGNRHPIPLRQGDTLLEPTYAMFLSDGIIAILTGGDGPHAQRLAEYLREKFHVNWSLEPILRDNLDEVLAELRITEVEFSIPAERIDRDLVGGDLFAALDAGRQLANDGTVRIGMSVGQKGDQNFKQRMSNRYHEVIDRLRQSAGLGEFNTARVRGQRRGNPQAIDLIQDRLVHTVDVEDDRWFDPDSSVQYASEVLTSEVDSGEFAANRIVSSNAGSVLQFNSERRHEQATD
ncbi:oxidoreductase [Brevibacterium aurantiacum]|uniref:Uncharacterized protein n=1 Tax=Brevibacterium aurantiacum TaxID=273384 RepID=A0A2H1JS95_BREAU|nr:oxidoreductase [Brevibacterium aurantiacum]SMX90148.1 hypothetical protein BAURA63_02564 [Brevibacterium aurantiacum]